MSDHTTIITKASAYLKRAGANSGDSFQFSFLDDVTIDATNFYRLIQGGNKITLAADDQDLSGKGFMTMHPTLDLVEGFSLLEYPMQAGDDGGYNLWIRYKAPTTTFKADLFFDGVVVESFEFASSTEFVWDSVKVVFPDDKKHIIGLQMQDKGNAIDKLYITRGSTVPTLKGPDISESPFFTVHMQVFATDADSVPTTPLFIYDYKNSIDHIRADDWYNFDTNVLDSRTGDAFTTSDKFALVLTSTGTSFTNFVIWELVDNDEYLATPSVIKG